jgi:hypothetical protein
MTIAVNVVENVHSKARVDTIQLQIEASLRDRLHWCGLKGLGGSTYKQVWLTSFIDDAQKDLDYYAFCPEGETCQSWKDGDFCVSLVAR